MRRRFHPTAGFPRDDTEGNLQSMELDEYKITKGHLYLVSDLSLILGFVSILLSIIVWFSRKANDPAGGERAGIFVGLWVPSFFILSNRLSRKAEEMEE